uniref:GDNF family receptor alpha 2b n=1 Tax=Kryptolebias marmoratus TaxID=37003 RepID=A0A3Q3B0R8_KRYMA
MKLLPQVAGLCYVFMSLGVRPVWPVLLLILNDQDLLPPMMNTILPLPEPLDCLRASELCNQNSQCSSRYRIMRQCLSGGDKERSTMLASKECQGALEVLQDSPLYDCRCKRGMKKELQCLQNYWSIHMGKPCNPCLDAAKACNLNDTCKRLRSAYNSICSKATPPHKCTANAANQTFMHFLSCLSQALRQFFERVSWEFSYPLLFCSCQDQACAERRRRTIVPSCSHQERHKPNCLELRHTCRSDALCRSRLADFHMNCQMTSHTVTSCPHDNYNGCLMSYVGLIGSDVTPNYSDNSPTNITISLWCTCRGAGHQEECDAFHRDFTHNTCLSKSCIAPQNQIQPWPFACLACPLSTENLRDSSVLLRTQRLIWRFKFLPFTGVFL